VESKRPAQPGAVEISQEQTMRVQNTVINSERIILVQLINDDDDDDDDDDNDE